MMMMVVAEAVAPMEPTNQLHMNLNEEMQPMMMCYRRRMRLLLLPQPPLLNWASVTLDVLPMIDEKGVKNGVEWSSAVVVVESVVDYCIHYYHY